MYTSLTRRFRKNEKLRKMIEEVKITQDDLIWPVFIKDGIGTPEEIENMPDVYRYSLDNSIAEIKKAEDLGISAIVVRPIPKKTDHGNWEKMIELQQDILNKISQECPQISILIDNYFTCVTRDGFYGIKKKDGTLDFEQTLSLLQDQAVAQAKAGADIVITLGRVDNVVAAIRDALNANGLQEIPIMAYAANFASTLAHAMLIDPEVSKIHKKGSLESKIGVGNIDEALRQVAIEVAQGADYLGIKPSIPFLDVIHQVKKTFKLPTATYIVSKEYNMVKAAARAGYLDEWDTVNEFTLGIKRAGADKIITYWAREHVQKLKFL